MVKYQNIVHTYFTFNSVVFKVHEHTNIIVSLVDLFTPGRVAQSVGHLTCKSGSWARYPVWQHTFVSPSAFSRRAVVSYWQKYVHEVLVNRLGLSLSRKSVVRLTDRPDMTLDVYRGHKTTIQQQQFTRKTTFTECFVLTGEAIFQGKLFLKERI